MGGCRYEDCGMKPWANKRPYPKNNLKKQKGLGAWLKW
jgi:hypothetical protein